jgi:medium-chain acyl-[acyl-carrier-protein] hydrolase
MNYRPNRQAVMRLFCFHYAGGGAHAYRSWADELPRNLEVIGVQQPGRGARMFETPLADYEPLVRAITAALLPLLDKPFAFFGHSMGAIVSFESARLLRREHALSPLHLFVGGRGGPRQRDVETNYSKLTDDELINELVRFEGAPQELLKHAELMRMMLPTIRADFAVCENYRYQSEPPLSCPITAFGGLKDQETSRERIEAWRDETSREFSFQMFSGGHFFLHSCQTLLLQSISRRLARRG